MKTKTNFPAISLFYFTAIICRYLSNKTNLLNDISNPFILAVLQGVGPALGALAAMFVYKTKPWMTLQGNYKGLILPLVLYWLLPIVLISGLSYYKTGEFPWFTVFTILIYGLLEEIGWRGFLQQELKPLPRFYSIFITASLWFIWHLNFELSKSSLVFFGILILGSWGIGKVADSTHSLLAASAFHSLNNFFEVWDKTKLTLVLSLVFIWVASLVIKKRQEVALKDEKKRWI